MQEDLGILVLDGDRVVVPQLYSPDGQMRSRETGSEQKVFIPWLFISNSLPCSVSWKAGDMKESPGPE